MTLRHDRRREACAKRIQTQFRAWRLRVIPMTSLSTAWEYANPLSDEGILAFRGIMARRAQFYVSFCRSAASEQPQTQIFYPNHLNTRRAPFPPLNEMIVTINRVTRRALEEAASVTYRIPAQATML